MAWDFSRIFRGGLVRNIGLLSLGTGIAQLIAVLALPILTRVYSPSDFELFAIYMSVHSIVGVIACLRYEIAIPIAETDKAATALVLLSVLAAFLMGLSSMLLLCAMSEFSVPFRQEKEMAYMYLLPFGIFLTGLFSALQYWAIRQKTFYTVAKVRVAQTTVGSGVQVGAGFLSTPSTAFGLILGHLFQVAVGVACLAPKFIKALKQYKALISAPTLIDVGKKYVRFPKYSVVESLANTSGLHLSIALIAFFVIDAEAGFIFLAVKLLSAPLNMVGGAVAQVYLSEAPRRHKAGDLRPFTVTIIRNLFFVSLPPLSIIGVASPYIIPFVFGAEWERTGELISWMIPWFILQFVVSPVSMTFHVQNRSHIALLIQLFGLIFRVGSIVLAIFYLPTMVGEVFAVSSFIFYLVYLLCVFLIFRKAQ